MILQPKTVLIKHPEYPDGIAINANDFNPDEHVLLDLDDPELAKEEEE